MVNIKFIITFPKRTRLLVLLVNSGVLYSRKLAAVEAAAEEEAAAEAEKSLKKLLKLVALKLLNVIKMLMLNAL
jgi:hypothetical protein